MDIEERLENWRRWTFEIGAPGSPQTASCFRVMLPDDHDKAGWGDDGSPPPITPRLAPTDESDAVLIDSLVQRLPENHKHALFWGYRIRGAWYEKARKAGAKYWPGDEFRARFSAALRAIEYLSDVSHGTLDAARKRA